MSKIRRKYSRASKPSVEDVIDLSSLSSSSSATSNRDLDSNDMFNNHAASTEKLRENQNLYSNSRKIKNKKSFDLKIASDVDRFLRNRHEKKSRSCQSSCKSNSTRKKQTNKNSPTSFNSNSEEYTENHFHDHLQQCTKCENQIRKCLDKSQSLPYIEKNHSFCDKRRKIQSSNKNTQNDCSNRESSRTYEKKSKNSLGCKLKSPETNQKYHRHHHHCNNDLSDESSTNENSVVEAAPLCIIL